MTQPSMGRTEPDEQCLSRMSRNAMRSRPSVDTNPSPMKRRSPASSIAHAMSITSPSVRIPSTKVSMREPGPSMGDRTRWREGVKKKQGRHQSQAGEPGLCGIRGTAPLNNVKNLLESLAFVRYNFGLRWTGPKSARRVLRAIGDHLALSRFLRTFTLNLCIGRRTSLTLPRWTPWPGFGYTHC